MGQRKTDTERAAALRARADALEAKERNRAARKASAEVRRLERDLEVMQRYNPPSATSPTVAEVCVSLRAQLTTARAAALGTRMEP